MAFMEVFTERVEPLKPPKLVHALDTVNDCGPVVLDLLFT